MNKTELCLNKFFGKCSSHLTLMYPHPNPSAANILPYLSFFSHSLATLCVRQTDRHIGNHLKVGYGEHETSFPHSKGCKFYFSRTPFFAEWNLEAVGFIQRLQFPLLCLHSRSYGSGPQAQL